MSVLVASMTSAQADTAEAICITDNESVEMHITEPYGYEEWVDDPLECEDCLEYIEAEDMLYERLRAGFSLLE